MENRLYAENLSVSYGKGIGKKTVFSNVNLELLPGEFACLCGSNGAGKSTLLSVLAGCGSNGIVIEGGGELFKQFLSLPKKQLAQKVAYMQQNEFSVWDFTVLEVVLQGRFSYTKNGSYTQKDYEIAREIIFQMGLENLAERNVHQLSGGEFQKVRIARALCQQPSFMLLDEPASQLDFVFEPKLMEFLKKQSRQKNMGILITIHDVNVAARYADKIHLMTDSGLISETATQVFTEENLKKAFGTKCRIYKHPMYNCLQVMSVDE